MKAPKLPSAVAPILIRLKVIGRHHYFFATVVLLSGLVVAAFVVNQTLAVPTDQAYREKRLGESLDVSFDRVTIEKIENLQKSNENPVALPKPASGVRTNPFAE